MHTVCVPCFRWQIMRSAVVRYFFLFLFDILSVCAWKLSLLWHITINEMHSHCYKYVLLLLHPFFLSLLEKRRIIDEVLELQISFLIRYSFIITFIKRSLFPFACHRLNVGNWVALQTIMMIMILDEYTTK